MEEYVNRTYVTETGELIQLKSSTCDVDGEIWYIAIEVETGISSFYKKRYTRALIDSGLWQPANGLNIAATIC